MQILLTVLPLQQHGSGQHPVLVPKNALDHIRQRCADAELRGAFALNDLVADLAGALQNQILIQLAVTHRILPAQGGIIPTADGGGREGNQ